MHFVLFEDNHVERLSPVTTARPAHSIACGGYRLRDWAGELAIELGGTVHGLIRPHLRAVCRLDDKIQPIDAADIRSLDDDVLLINSRIAATMGARETIKLAAAAKSNSTMTDPKSGSLLMARLDAETVKSLPAAETVDELCRSVIASKSIELEPSDAVPLGVYHWPHDVVRIHMAAIGDSLSHRIRTGTYQQIRDGVFVASDVSIGEHCVFDTSAGPVVLEERVQIGPYCYFAGPVHAAAGTRVIEHSAIKDAVSVGHTCKIGGEVEASIIEPYTNKQHHGFLGHSYLGSWINLGAGTCNSDLKNTYGKINVEYGGNKVATEMQFFGCVMGDYSKTAINTSIFTGKVIGVCSMMYGFVTSNVPSYVNYARLFGQTSLLPPEVMISTQKRMFARRRVTQRDCDKQLIRDMYKITAEERAADADLL